MTVHRKTRSDKTVKSIEKELGIPLLKKDGTKHPGNKVLGTIRKEELLSGDQKAASKRTVKVHPKSKSSTVKMVVKSLQTSKK